MAENRNEKEVLLKVRTDTSEANSGLEEVRGKIEQANESARELSRVDYGSMSVKELKEELDKAEMSMEALARSGNATEGAMKVLGDRVDEINKGLTSIGTNKATQTFEANMRVAIGAVESVGGALTFIGVESETANEALARMAGLMSFTNGIKDMIEYGQKVGITQKAVLGWQKVQQMANTTLGRTKLALAGLGIGLITVAIAYLIENWDSLVEGFREAFPQLDKLSEWFSQIQPIMMGVGRAVIAFVIEPIKSLAGAVMSLVRGEFKEAGNQLVDALNPVKRYKDVVAGFKTGYSNAIVKANAEKDEEIEKSAERTQAKVAQTVKKSADDQKRIYDELKKYIEEAERTILENSTEARELELSDVKKKYSERIALAEQLGEDTSALVEAQRLEEQAINDKYDKEEIALAERTAKELRDAKLKAANLSAENTVLGGTLSGDPLDEYASRLEALRINYEAELELFEGSEEEKLNIKLKYDNEVKKLTDAEADRLKKAAEDQKKIDETVWAAKLDIASSVLGSLASMLGEATVAGKAAAIAQTTIDTYQSATSSYKALSGIPIVGPALGAAAAGAAIVAGLANVRKIASVRPDGSNSITAPSAPASVRSAPVINTTILRQPDPTDINSLGDNQSEAPTAPIRAYIVSSDLSKDADKRQLTENLSTF